MFVLSDVMDTLKLAVLLLNIVYVYGELSPEFAKTLQDVCPDFDTCYETGNSLVNSCCLPCSCDFNVCTGTGNCCPHLNASIPQTESNHTNHSNWSDTSCVATTVNLKFTFKKLTSHESSGSFARIGVPMITSCPGELNETRCTNPDLTVLNQSMPILSKTSGYSYRNIFCVQCNNESMMETLPWKTFVTCSAIDVTKADDTLFPVSADKIYQTAASTKVQACGVDFMPPSDNIVHDNLCFQSEDIIDSCPVGYSNQSIVNACNSFKMPYAGLKDNVTDVYRNYFCYLCNLDNIEEDDQCYSDGFKLQVHMDEYNMVAELNTNRSNTSLIIPPWIQNDLTPSKFNPSGVKCRDRMVFDPFTDSCRYWYCPSGRQFANDKDCIPNYVDVMTSSYTVALKFVPDVYTLTAYQPLNKTILAHSIVDQLFDGSPSPKVEIIVLAVKRDFSYMYAFLKVTIDAETENKSSIYDEATYQQNISITSGSDTISFDVELSVGVKVELSSLPMSNIIVIDQVAYTALENVFKVHLNDVKAAYKLPTINKLAFCTQILLKRDEVFDFIDVFDVLLSDTRMHYGEFARTPDYTDLRICLTDYLRDIQKYLDHKNKQREYTPQAVLSVICNMMSMAGLLATIFTYILFDELRSIPGKNNMMLALHLLIAQILYQFGMDQTDMPTLCIALGVFIHLFWLTAIFWMNACTLHMFRTFVTGQSYRSVRALDPQVCCYALYCYGVATTMVAINMSISLYKSGGTDVGYGGRVCYISNPIMVGWVFALPVGVIIILNMGFFFAVVYQISASTMRRRGKSTDRANTVIYMKLSSLTGVTWIFGYLYLWTDFSPLEYIFIVLNAGQGVFIFISFICTQRITKLYWNLMRKGCRSVRSKSCCNSCRKIGDTDTNGVEMNTAKVSLTAGSTSTKGPNSSRKGVPVKVQAKPFKKVAANHSLSNSNGNSSSDIYNDSAKLAHDLCNPTPNTKPIATIKTDDSSVAIGAAENKMAADVPGLAIAIGIHDIKFIPASTKSPVIP